MDRLIHRNMVVFSFLVFRLVEVLKAVLFVEMKGTRVIMCIHNHETTTGLIVLICEPVFQDVKNLSTNKATFSLKILVNTQASNQYCRVATTSLCIVDMTILAIACRAFKVSRLDAVIGYGEETSNPVWLGFGNPTICFTEQFFLV